MKKIKQPGFFNLSWLGGKTTYTEEKWLGGQEDPRGERGRIEDYYLNHGYVTARVGQPRISYVDKPGGSKKKPVKYMKLEVPITEGAQYRMGSLKFEGLTVLKEGFVRGLFKMQEGDVYNDSHFKKAYEKLRDVYGSLGYFQWTGGTDRKPDPEKKVVDVTVKMEEDKQYFLGKLNFTGNDSTRDKVIRREIYMNEGDVFNTEALKMSIKRINQLGYFKQMESAPDIQPSQEAENKVDVTFKVQEQNRNQFTFGGGVSGYEGAFLNASFSTTNFLGAGETVSLAVQTGSRTKNYAFSVSEPYLLDRPITAGFNVFLNRITYLSYGQTVGYGQQTQGLSVTGGRAIGKFSRLYMGYSYQIIDIYDVDKNALEALQRASQQQGTSLPIIDPSYIGADGRRHESGISPSFVRNTVDNPYQPRSGSRHTASVQLVGGPFRGTRQLRASHPREHLVRSRAPPDGARPARPGGADPPLRGYHRDPVLPALLPGRGDADPRLQRAQRRALRRGESHLGGRRQVPALQRRVLLRRLRAAAAAALLRRRRGLRAWAELLLENDEHVYRRRGPLHHARPQRAVSADLRMEPQP